VLLPLPLFPEKKAAQAAAPRDQTAPLRTRTDFQRSQRLNNRDFVAAVRPSRQVFLRYAGPSSRAAGSGYPPFGRSWKDPRRICQMILQPTLSEMPRPVRKVVVGIWFVA
jgi:hypothetical protein